MASFLFLRNHCLSYPCIFRQVDGKLRHLQVLFLEIPVGRGCSSVEEHLLCVQKVPSSILDVYRQGQKKFPSETLESYCQSVLTVQGALLTHHPQISIYVIPSFCLDGLLDTTGRQLWLAGVCVSPHIFHYLWNLVSAESVGTDSAGCKGPTVLSWVTSGL